MRFAVTSFVDLHQCRLATAADSNPPPRPACGRCSSPTGPSSRPRLDGGLNKIHPAPHGCFLAAFDCFGAGTSWDLLRRAAPSAAAPRCADGDACRRWLWSRAAIRWRQRRPEHPAACPCAQSAAAPFSQAACCATDGSRRGFCARLRGSKSFFIGDRGLRRTLHTTPPGRCNGRPNQLAHATWHLSSVIPGRPDAVCARIKRSSINRPVAAWDFEPNPRCDWAVYRRAQIALCKPFSGRVPSHRERTRCMGAFFDDAEASGDHGKVKHLKKWPFPLCAKTCFVTVSPGSRNGRTTAC